MRLNKLFLTIVLSCSGLVSLQAQEAKPQVQNKSYTESQVQDINDTLDSDYLYQYYKENSPDSRVQIDYEYMIDRPLNMDEIRDLKHPYFDKHISNLTDEDVDEIMNTKMQSQFKGLRNNSIFDEAVKYGIQSALYKVLYDFSNKIEDIAPYYDNVFNFNTLMLYNGRVKPPVVLKTTGSLEKENPKLLRQVKRSYEFKTQAEVVLRPPSFRDYLTFEPIRPEQPNPILLPLPNKPQELAIWEKGVSEGWLQGLRQAYIVIDEGLISLATDYLGMQRYLGMLDEGIVTLPVVTESELETSTNGNTINIGESTFTISELPEFNTNSSSWRALPRIDSIFEEGSFYLSKDKMAEIEALKEELQTDRY